jgi:SAM-dependent methyltransferase
MEMEGFEKRVLMSRPWGWFSRSAIVPWFAAFARFPERADVLEVGCGSGFNAGGLLRRFPAWLYTATDYDDDMVALASRRLARFGDRVRVEQADATALDYPEASFDVVVAIGVWHHVGVWEKATAEAGRVLRPGGRLVMVDLLQEFFGTVNERLFPPTRPYGLEDVADVLAEAGFRRWRVRRTGRRIYRLVAEKG